MKKLILPLVTATLFSLSTGLRAASTNAGSINIGTVAVNTNTGFFLSSNYGQLTNGGIRVGYFSESEAQIKALVSGWSDSAVFNNANGTTTEYSIPTYSHFEQLNSLFTQVGTGGSNGSTVSGWNFSTNGTIAGTSLGVSASVVASGTQLYVWAFNILSYTSADFNGTTQWGLFTGESSWLAPSAGTISLDPAEVTSSGVIIGTSLDPLGAGVLTVNSLALAPEPTTWGFLLFSVILFFGVSLRRRYLAKIAGKGTLILLLSGAISAHATGDTNAIFFCVAGNSASAGTTQNYAAPGSGWVYSAVAQVPGTTWNYFGIPSGTAASSATTGTFQIGAPSNSVVKNPAGSNTTILLNANVTVPTAVASRVEPNNGNWGSVSQTTAPLTAGWRIYNSSDYVTFSLTNLVPNQNYLLYTYAAYVNAAAYGGACVVLSSGNVPSGGASWLDVPGCPGGTLFNTNTPGAFVPVAGAAAGVTNSSAQAPWGAIQAVTDSSGNLAFSCGRPGRTNGVGLVSFPSLANSTLSGTGGSWINAFQVIPYPVAVISVQPSSAPSVTSGSTASLSVTATNWYTNNNITYQWQLNGTKLTNGSTGTGSTISGATSATLNVSNAGSSDAGTYTVVVSNPGGSVTSSNSVLDVSSSIIAPSIVTQPATTNVSAGSTASISVSANGTAPLTYQWQWSTDGTNFSNIGSNNAILSITSAQITNSGYYNVTITNSAGSVISSNAVLTITQNQITNQPTGGLFTNGASNTLSVSVAVNPPPTYQWQLSVDGYRFTNVTGGTGSTLPLTMSSNNSGFYRVISSNSVGATTSSVVFSGIASTTLGTPTLSPANNAVSVNRDTPFKLTFSGTPVVGSSGTIRVYNATNNALVASYNMGTMTIAPGTYQSGTNAPYTIFHQTTKSINGNSVTYTPIISLGSQPGPTNFPITPAGYNSNTAIITLPASTTLSYGTSYYVQMDPGVFVDTNGAAYPGISDTTSWTFTVKAAGPTNGTTSIVVGNDGTTTDFSTLEGAAEFVPTSNTTPTTVTIRQGFYPEVVYWKSPNVTIQGQGRTNTVIAFINNNYVNPSTATRPVMDVVTSRVTLQDLAIYNMTPYNGSQAETIYTYGSNLNLIRVGLYSYQDTLLANAGSLFVTDSYIEGNVDYMWGTAATYFQRCELKANTNNGSAVAGYTQARNASNGYGFSYVNCTLDAYPGVTNNSYSLSRSFSAEYPFNQTAYINCRMGPHIVPAGWQLYDGTGVTSQLWEYQSRDLSNNLLTSSVLTNRPTYNRSFSVNGTNIVYTAAQNNSPDVLANGQISAALAAIMTNSTQILGWTPTSSPDAVITPTSNAITIYQGSSFADPGATVVDPADGTLSIASGNGTVDPTTIGSYTVTYGYTNSLRIPAAPATMTVTVAAIPTASISFSGTNVPYNGNPRPVAVTTTPSNVAVAVTYNGSATAPTAVGTYAVNASVTASNYQGSNSTTLTIYDASALWRQAFYGTTSNSGNAADSADPYGTGLSNLQNYTLGNNPTLPATNPLGNTTSSNGLFTLSFTAVPAGNGAGYAGLTRHYALESSTNPAGPVWSSISGYDSIAASNQTVSFSTNTTNFTNWFVRIRAWLQ